MKVEGLDYSGFSFSNELCSGTVEFYSTNIHIQIDGWGTLRLYNNYSQKIGERLLNSELNEEELKILKGMSLLSTRYFQYEFFSKFFPDGKEKLRRSLRRSFGHTRNKRVLRWMEENGYGDDAREIRVKYIAKNLSTFGGKMPLKKKMLGRTLWNHLNAK